MKGCRAFTRSPQSVILSAIPGGRRRKGTESSRACAAIEPPAFSEACGFSGRARSGDIPVAVHLRARRQIFLVGARRAAAVSLALVTGYLWLATTRKFAVISAFAQFASMVLFSYSFFFDGLTGITITVGAIITLALLMAFTARVKWDAALTSRATPPPMPQPVA